MGIFAKTDYINNVDNGLGLVAKRGELIPQQNCKQSVDGPPTDRINSYGQLLTEAEDVFIWSVGVWDQSTLYTIPSPFKSSSEIILLPFLLTASFVQPECPVLTFCCPQLYTNLFSWLYSFFLLTYLVTLIDTTAATRKQTNHDHLGQIESVGHVINFVESVRQSTI